MEESREQPIIMPATALNVADEDSAKSEVGSQGEDLGKFKSVQALMDAYNSLQAEFTKKCQKLSQLQKDKTELNLNEGEKSSNNLSENEEKELENTEKTLESTENNLSQTEIQAFDEKKLNQFLERNYDASEYAEEIKKRFSLANSVESSPYEVAWAQTFLEHLKDGNKLSDPLINQYVLSDENVKRKIVEDYLNDLNNSKPPLIMSSQSGERLSGVMPDSPKTLAEAKKLVDKMFS